MKRVLSRAAVAQQKGLFEEGDGCTIFLDEIGELPLNMQADLLRVIQEGEIKRLGGKAVIKVNVRIIAATNRNLREEVQKGRFRQDLFYRLNVLPLEMPTLPERREDIPLPMLRTRLGMNSKCSCFAVPTK